MRVQCLSDNRDLILRVLRQETGAERAYCSPPRFSVRVGGYTLGRDGWIETDDPDPRALAVLASMGLCDFSEAPAAPIEQSFAYPMDNQSGTSLLNLLSILSARQHLLNRALDARGAFLVARPLMNDLLDHPPETVPEFLQSLYGRDREYRGVDFSLGFVSLSGFCRGHREEEAVHRQLADRIMNDALTKRWAKAFTPRVKNQKYAFRIWLNSIGMVGPDYGEARRVMLGRLPGRTDRRSLTAREG